MASQNGPGSPGGPAEKAGQGIAAWVGPSLKLGGTSQRPRGLAGLADVCSWLGGAEWGSALSGEVVAVCGRLA